ncbi:MAG: integrase core domain-containing protein [Chthoniobacteraceae bacterium]
MEDLILRFAKENAWGYSRIQGELRKLGIIVARNTVKKILIKDGFHPNPGKRAGDWALFLRRHMDTLWACVFFVKDMWTGCGKVTYYVLFFIHVNAFSERFVQSIKQEFLSQFVVFGEHHLNYLIRDYEAYYNTVRPHQGLENKPLVFLESRLQIPARCLGAFLWQSFCFSELVLQASRIASGAGRRYWRCWRGGGRHGAG